MGAGRELALHVDARRVDDGLTATADNLVGHSVARYPNGLRVRDDPDLLDETAARTALGWVFQALAAIHATYPSGVSIPPAVAASNRDAEALRTFGGMATDEHTIKLAEALLREYELAPRTEFLAAADG